MLARTAEGKDPKLQARFAWSGGVRSGSQYELAGTVTDAGADCQALWRALVTGRLEPFQRVLADPARAPAGLRLDPASSLARSAGRHHGFSLEVVVLRMAVSIRSIVEGKASITLSAGGDVAVTAQGSASREVDGFDEGRAPASSAPGTWLCTTPTSASGA
ncbi:hypothetical protein [Novosphingobium chloroacetimidivorans]|nr:hypothetical protein [Novosphingobium chloroacetimidivorans]